MSLLKVIREEIVYKCMQTHYSIYYDSIKFLKTSNLHRLYKLYSKIFNIDFSPYLSILGQIGLISCLKAVFM